MADNNSMKLQEGVQISQAEIKSEGQIKRTTAAATALLALALYAGSPAPAKADTPTDNKAVATIVVNAEYEAIIATAKKEGKNPLEYAKAKKEGGEWTIKDYIAFSKYNRDLQDRSITIAQQEQDKARQQLIVQAKTFIVVFEKLLREGKFTSKEEAIVNELYSDAYLPSSIKQELITKFGKYIGKGMTIAQNTAN